MSLSAHDTGAFEKHLAETRLSSREAMYSRWLDGRPTPPFRPELVSLSNVSCSEPSRVDHSHTDEPFHHPTRALTLSAPGHVGASPTRMEPQACFALIVGQVASLFEAAQRGPTTPDKAVVIANEATPLRPSPANNPIGWSTRRKWCLTFLVGLTMFNGSFASTAPNGAGAYMVMQFRLSNEEMVFIATSFVGGCVAGPVLWAPLSEIYGRRLVFLISTLLYSITNIGCALATTKAILFSCRFLAGICASSAFSNAAAVTTDLFAPPDRNAPLIVVSLAPLLGPCFGPLFGSGVSRTLRWPFVFWLLGATGLVLALALFCLPETYLPVITARTKPKEVIFSQETWQQKARTFFVINLGRPVSI